MEETVLLPQEINRLCRTCMSIALDDHQFAENSLFEGSQPSNLGSMLEYLTSAELTNNKTLPAGLCEICVEQLKQAYSFKKQCEDVQNNLKDLLKTFENEYAHCSEVENDEDKLGRDTNQDDLEKLLGCNFPQFFCNICSKTFDSQYKLSLDIIEHNKGKSLLDRYLENFTEDSKDILIEDNISQEVYDLIKMRKSECSLIKKENTVKQFIDFKQKFSNGDIDIFSVIKNNSVSTSDECVEKVIDASNSNLNEPNPTKNKHLKKVIKTNQIFSVVKCFHCNKKFTSRNKFKSHVCLKKTNKTNDSKETPANIYLDCDLCDKSFSNILSLAIHFIYHVILEETVKNSVLLEGYIFCSFCGQLFSTEGELQSHRDDQHANETEQFLCEICGESFKEDLELLIHVDQFHEIESAKKAYNCPICSEVFEDRASLLNHGLKTHFMKRVYCRLCRTEFCNPIALNEHMKIHGYRHACKICGRHLSSSNSLKSHMMGLHSQDALFMCTVCGKCFKTQNRLSVHREIHNAVKKFMCSFCGYRTHKSGDLKIHLRIHTQQHPYKCTFPNCTRAFRTSSHFNQHIRHHLDIKQYECPYCAQKFSHSYSLKLHKMRHTGEKPHSCILCPSTFRRKDHLRLHMKQHQK